MKCMNAALCSLLVTTIMVGGVMLGVGQNSPVLAEPAAPTAPLPVHAPYASEINAFQEADKQQMPTTDAVLFIGSSSIRLWETLAQDFPEIPVINRGFGGSEIEDSARYADRIAIPYAPKLIVFYAGGNDINSGKTPERVLQDFKAFVAKVQGALLMTRIAFVSINPTLSRWSQEPKILEANRLIKKFVDDTASHTEKLSFIDSHARLLNADGQPQAGLLRDDKLHFNTEGYKAWTAIIKPQILALAAQEGVARLDVGGEKQNPR